MNQNQTALKIIIKAVLALILFGCLLKMPYGYYQMVRFTCFAGFAGIAYMDYKIYRFDGIIIGTAGAILFNPFYKVVFKRDAWQTIDLVLGCLLILWIIIDITLKKSK